MTYNDLHPGDHFTYTLQDQQSPTQIKLHLPVCVSKPIVGNPLAELLQTHAIFANAKTGRISIFTNPMDLKITKIQQEEKINIADVKLGQKFHFNNLILTKIDSPFPYDTLYAIDQNFHTHTLPKFAVVKIVSTP